MSRLQAWLLHISTIVLTATGLVYAFMHYLLKPADPFSVINHPAEPYLIDIHILTAPLLTVMVGVILHSHIIFKLQGGTRIARKSGIFLLPLFVIMTLSGYALQVVNGDARKIYFAAHLITGTLWFLGYVAHHIASFRVRSMQRQNGRPLNGNPASKNPRLLQSASSAINAGKDSADAHIH